MRSASPLTARLTLGMASLALAALSGSAATFAADGPQAKNDSHEGHASSSQSSRSRHAAPLVERVQKATRRFRNINVAIAEGWRPGTPCVSGPNSGAMGVHFVLKERIDGKVNPDEPEALMYEPLPGGGWRLVGVEYIIIAEAWANEHPKDPVTPSIDGHLTHYVGQPNRYGLPAFYELHVWAWADNPEGNFADWNPEVSCDRQVAPE
jgi:hypothetical protein